MPAHFCRVWFADTAPLAAPSLFAEGYRRMSPARQAKIDRLRFDEGKRLSLGAGLLLRTALASAGLDAATEPIETGPCEKPYLAAHPELRFNLSHSGTRVLCVLSDLDCGCDVERIGQGSPALADRFFAPEEQERLKIPGPADSASRHPPENGFWQRLFCRIWTRKESYLKATGEGLSRSLSSFSVFSPPPAAHFLDYQDSPDTLSSVCLLMDPTDSDASLPEPVRIPVHFHTPLD